MQVVHHLRVASGQGLGEEIRLFLVVALQRHPVARTQQRLKRLSKPRAVEYLALPICRHAGEPVRLGLSALIPYRWRGNLGRHATVPPAAAGVSVHSLIRSLLFLTVIEEMSKR